MEKQYHGNVKKEQELVSVIMSVYNAEKYIDECITSILNQTYANIEFIIIDDASEDGTLGKIEQYKNKDDRIILIKNKENLGLTKNLNKGIKIAKGKYIARMDSDDIAVNSRIEKQAVFMETHTDVSICGTWAYRISESGKKEIKLKPKVNDRDIKARQLCGNCMVHPSVMIRRIVFDHILYDETFRTLQDFKLWVDCRNYKFHNIPEYLMYYRNNSKGISAVGKKKKHERLYNARRIYQTLFEQLNIRLTEEELEKYVECMYVVSKFKDSKESEDLLKICRKVIRQYPNSDKKCIYSRWARGNKTFPKMKYMTFFIQGYLSWIFELAEMFINLEKIKQINMKK